MDPKFSWYYFFIWLKIYGNVIGQDSTAVENDNKNNNNNDNLDKLYEWTVEWTKCNEDEISNILISYK